METGMTTTLVLGGARSGKSRYAQETAETLAVAAGRTPVMIVTAQAFDDEMTDRIMRHREDRADRWRTVEAPTDLETSLAALSPEDVAVADCLTLWLSNRMLADDDMDAACAGLVAAVAACPARLFLVSNEVGWGVVPDNALARRFRDLAGRLHQDLAARVDEAILVVAGLPIQLKTPQ